MTDLLSLPVLPGTGACVSHSSVLAEASHCPKHLDSLLEIRNTPIEPVLRHSPVCRAWMHEQPVCSHWQVSSGFSEVIRRAASRFARLQLSFAGKQLRREFTSTSGDDSYLDNSAELPSCAELVLHVCDVRYCR